MLSWWGEFSGRPLIAHLLRAVERFGLRGGNQLAAGVAYYSVVSLVPVLMLAFAALGLTLTVFMPDSLTAIEQSILAMLPPGLPDQTTEDLYGLVRSSLGSWATIGGGALALGFWVGSNWIGNLRRAFRLVMLEDADNPGERLPLPLDLLANFAGLIGLFLGVVATFALSSGATTLFGHIGDAIGLSGSPRWSLVLRAVGLLVSMAAGTGLFRLLFAWLAPGWVPRAKAWIGAALGSVSLLVLQLLTGVLISVFFRNATAALFGVAIVLLLFLNLFATLILFIAAWLATEEAPQLVADESEPEPTTPVESEPGQRYVSAQVAEKTLGAGLKAGYVAGAATGLGLGALLAGLLRKRG